MQIMSGSPEVHWPIYAKHITHLENGALEGHNKTERKGKKSWWVKQLKESYDTKKGGK